MALTSESTPLNLQQRDSSEAGDVKGGSTKSLERLYKDFEQCKDDSWVSKLVCHLQKTVGRETATRYLTDRQIARDEIAQIHPPSPLAYNWANADLKVSEKASLKQVLLAYYDLKYSVNNGSAAREWRKALLGFATDVIPELQKFNDWQAQQGLEVTSELLKQIEIIEENVWNKFYNGPAMAYPGESQIYTDQINSELVSDAVRKIESEIVYIQNWKTYCQVYQRKAQRTAPALDFSHLDALLARLKEAAIILRRMMVQRDLYIWPASAALEYMSKQEASKYCPRYYQLIQRLQDIMTVRLDQIQDEMPIEEKFSLLYQFWDLPVVLRIPEESEPKFKAMKDALNNELMDKGQDEMLKRVDKVLAGQADFLKTSGSLNAEREAILEKRSRSCREALRKVWQETLKGVTVVSKSQRTDHSFA